MDRGYPSIPSFLRMIDKEIKFVVRLKSSDFKVEQQSLASDDEDFSLRLVTVHLENGNSEILATNLPREQFPQEDCLRSDQDQKPHSEQYIPGNRYRLT